jgi:2-dehydropantoate 2-reductase
VIGGRLVQAGHDAVLVARGRHAEVMRRRGLLLRSPEGESHIDVEVAERADQVGWTGREVVILAVKSQDTSEVLDALASVADPGTPIVCAQNGVANERTALRRFAHVHGICVMCPATHLEPGVVDASSAPISGILDIGRFPAGVDATSEEVAAALERSTFVSLPRPDIMRWKHTKLLMNLANALEAAIGPEARTSELARLARREGRACFDAAGIDAASAEEDRERRGDLLRVGPVAGGERGGGSSWQSLARGTGRIEADYLNGEIVLLGRLHGVATPVNAMLQQVARELAHSGVPPGSLTEGDLLARV